MVSVMRCSELLYLYDRGNRNGAHFLNEQVDASISKFVAGIELLDMCIWPVFDHERLIF